MSLGLLLLLIVDEADLESLVLLVVNLQHKLFVLDFVFYLSSFGTVLLLYNALRPRRKPIKFLIDFLQKGFVHCDLLFSLFDLLKQIMDFLDSLDLTDCKVHVSRRRRVMSNLRLICQSLEDLQALQ